MALAHHDGFIPATSQEIAKQLEFIASTLPSKNIDEASGQKRFAVFVRILGGYSKPAISYMTERVCRELNWFPTPKQCLDILADYHAPESLPQRAIRKCQNFAQKQLEGFMETLAAAEVGQSYIDEQPERWQRIAEEKGYLRWDGERFIQRKAAIKAEAAPDAAA